MPSSAAALPKALGREDEADPGERTIATLVENWVCTNSATAVSESSWCEANNAVQEYARFNTCCGRNWVPQAPLSLCLGREADNAVNRHGRESPFPKVRLQWREYQAEKI